MSVLPALFIELKANVSEFTAKMGQARGQVETLKRDGSGHFDQLATVGKAAFLGLGAAAVAFGASAVKVGIEQEEANARLTTALHNTGSAMTALSEPVEAAESKMRKFGFTNGDTTDSLATLTNATHNPTKALGDLGLAADVARARHIDLSAATDLLAKVETGHVSLLGRIGIDTKDATGKTIDQTEAIKRLSDMYGGQADAYSKTFAGRMAELKAQVENVQEQVGLFLIPKIEALVHIGAGAIEWAEKNKTAAEVLAAVIGGPLVIAMGAYVVQETKVVAGKIIEYLTSTGKAAQTAAVAVQGYVASIAAALGPVELIGAAVGILTGAITLNTTHTKDAKDAATAYLDGIKGSGDELSIAKQRIEDLSKARDQQYLATARAAASEGTWQKVAGQARATYDQQTAAIDVLKGRVKDLSTAHKGAADAAGDLAAAQKKAGRSTDDLADRFHISTTMVGLLADKLRIDLTKATDEQTASLGALADRLRVASPTALDLSDALAKLADKTADAKEKANAFKSALDNLIGTNISVEKATVDFEAAIDGLSQKIKANKDNLDVHTAAGRANIQMNEDAVEKIRAHADAVKQQTGSTEQATAALNADTAELVRQWQQAGLTADQIDKLRQQYGLIPANINTIINADTDPAQKAWSDLMASAQPYLNLLSKLPAASVKGYAGGITVPHFAAGGSFGPGDMLVGEEGPEFMHIGPDGRGYVRNASQTRAMFTAGGRPVGGAGGGTTINNYYSITVPVAGSVSTERDLVDAIHNGLLSKQQREGLGFRS